MNSSVLPFSRKSFLESEKFCPRHYHDDISHTSRNRVVYPKSLSFTILWLPFAVFRVYNLTLSRVKRLFLPERRPDRPRTEAVPLNLTSNIIIKPESNTIDSPYSFQTESLFDWSLKTIINFGMLGVLDIASIAIYSNASCPIHIVRPKYGYLSTIKNFSLIKITF